MALRSKWPDVEIPDNLSWSEYVFQNAEKYSERTAIVSQFITQKYVDQLTMCSLGLLTVYCRVNLSKTSTLIQSDSVDID